MTAWRQCALSAENGIAAETVGVARHISSSIK